jgi:hypothetical protein
MLKLFGHFVPARMLGLMLLEMAVLGATLYYLLSTGVHSPQILESLKGGLGRMDPR